MNETIEKNNTTAGRTLGSDRVELADWVTHQAETCRGGRILHTLVNHRDNKALELLDSEAGPDGVLTPDLLDVLRSDGFLADAPELTGPPAPGRLAHFLSTLDISWTSADRLVQWLYRRGLRHAFRPVAVVMQVLLAIVGIVATVSVLSSGESVHLSVEPHLIPIFIGIGLAAVAVHELAHAVVVAHHGRSIASIGFRLHLGTPSFYVDSVDALVLTRRARMVQAAAGPWVEWLFTSVAAIVLWVAPLPGPATAILARFVALNMVTVVSNLLPFVGMDGSHLLADAIRVPDLHRRCRGSVGRVITGVAARRRPEREDLLLALYAMANAVVAAGLFALAMFLWVEMFSGLVGSLWSGGPLGMATLVVAAVILGRPAVTAVLPQLLDGIATARQLAHDVRFRRSVPWRIAATDHLRATDPAIAALDAATLGLVAGLLTRTRRSGRPPLAGDHDDQVVVHLGPVPGARFGLVAALDRAVLESLGRPLPAR